MKSDVLDRRGLDRQLQHASGLNVMYPSYFDHQTMDMSEDKRRKIQEKVLVKHRHEQEKQNSFERNLVDSERRKGQRPGKGNDPRNLNFDFRDSYHSENNRHYGTESARELHNFERMYDSEGEARRSQSSFGHIQSPRSPSSQQVYDPQIDLYEKLNALKVPKINTKRVPGFSSYAQKFRQDSIMRSNNSSRSTMLTNSTVNSNMSSRNNSGRSRDLISPSRIPRRQRDVTSETSLMSSEGRGIHSVDLYNSRQGLLYSPLKNNERYGEWNDYTIPERSTTELINEEMQELQKTKGAIHNAKVARGTIQVTLKSDEKVKDKQKTTNNNKNGHKRNKKQTTEQNAPKDNENPPGTEPSRDNVSSVKQVQNTQEPGSIKNTPKAPQSVAQSSYSPQVQESVSESKVQYNPKKKPNKPETKGKLKEKSAKVPAESDTESARSSQTTKEKLKSGEGSKLPVTSKDKLSKGQALEKEIAKVQEDYLAHRTANSKQKQPDNAATSSNKSNAAKNLRSSNTTDSKNNPGKSGQNVDLSKSKTGDVAKKDKSEKGDKEAPDAKPKKGILRKTSSFKVIGNSDHYFGYMSISDGVAVEKKQAKRVRYHADHYPEVRPISA